jgi:N-acetylglucosaminyldiphosphoundecaprenol N-acetyl-beta-D-mannosaminyltransferase
MDLLPALLQEAEKKDLSVFFYGGTQEMLEETKKYLYSNFPGICRSSFYSPPFRKLTVLEEDLIVSEINSSGANLIFVVLGCPKQERWMNAMKGRVNACMIGVGGALPVMIGLQNRAPVWMQRNGLEWLFRLFQEPKRLWRRYLFTNTKFIFLVFKEWIRRIKT